MRNSDRVRRVTLFGFPFIVLGTLLLLGPVSPLAAARTPLSPTTEYTGSRLTPSEWVPLDEALTPSGETREGQFTSEAAATIRRYSLRTVPHTSQIPGECESEQMTLDGSRSRSLDSSADHAKWVFTGRVLRTEAGLLKWGDAGTLLTVEIKDRLRSPQHGHLPDIVYVFYPWVNARIGDIYLCAREAGLSEPPSTGDSVVVLTQTYPRNAKGTLFVPGVGEVIDAAADNGALRYSPAHAVGDTVAPATLNEFRAWILRHPFKASPLEAPHGGSRE